MGGSGLCGIVLVVAAVLVGVIGYFYNPKPPTETDSTEDSPSIDIPKSWQKQYEQCLVTLSHQSPKPWEVLICLIGCHLLSIFLESSVALFFSVSQWLLPLNQVLPKRVLCLGTQLELPSQSLALAGSSRCCNRSVISNPCTKPRQSERRDPPMFSLPGGPVVGFCLHASFFR